MEYWINLFEKYWDTIFIIGFFLVMFGSAFTAGIVKIISAFKESRKDKNETT